jgi:predicted permease
MLPVVGGQVIILFLLMAVGFLLSKLKKLTPVGVGQLSTLLINVSMPCAVIDSLQLGTGAAPMHRLGIAAILIFLFYPLKILIAHLISKNAPEDTRAPLRFGMVFGNVGFMGIPLIRSVFGDNAVIYAAIAMAVFSVYQWTYGVVIMGGRSQVSVKNAFLTPGMIGTAIGLVLFIADVTLPYVPREAVSFLGDLNTPVAMIVIGAQMANTDMSKTFTTARIWISSAVKTLLVPCLALLLLLPFRLDSVSYAALVTLAATPTAAGTSIFAQRFNRDTGTSAQLVSLSTIVSIITLPLFAILALFIKA